MSETTNVVFVATPSSISLLADRKRRPMANVALDISPKIIRRSCLDYSRTCLAYLYINYAVVRAITPFKVI